MGATFLGEENGQAVVDGMAGSTVPVDRIKRSVFSGLKTVFVSLGDPSPRPPWDFSPWCQKQGGGERNKSGRRGHPALLSTPGTALGLLPSRALSSAQAGTDFSKAIRFVRRAYANTEQGRI